MEKDRRRFTYLESVFSLDFFGCLGGSKGRTKLFECLYYFCQIDSTSIFTSTPSSNPNQTRTGPKRAVRGQLGSGSTCLDMVRLNFIQNGREQKNKLNYANWWWVRFGMAWTSQFGMVWRSFLNDLSNASFCWNVPLATRFSPYKVPFQLSCTSTCILGNRKIWSSTSLKAQDGYMHAYIAT